MREANLSSLLWRLHVHGPASRSALGVATGLTRSSVGALVGELVERGFVSEEPGASDGTPGRPSPVVVPRADNAVLALEVLVDTIAVGAVGLGGDRLAMLRSDRSRTRHPVERTVQDLERLVRSVLAELPPSCRLFGVGIAVAGLVRTTGGRVSMGPNIGWSEVDFGDQIADALDLGVPTLTGNDADLGVVADLRRGTSRGARDVVYVSAEVGVGGGIISGGRQIGGADGFGGEVGHLMVNVDGRECRCGAVGCWETEVGEEALLRRAGRPVDGGRQAVSEVLAAAAAGDTAALDGLLEHARWVGIGLAALVNLFNPEQIVLGGFLARAWPLIASTVTEEVGRRGLDPAAATLTIGPTALGVDAPLLGAAELAWTPVIDGVTRAPFAPIADVS